MIESNDCLGERESKELLGLCLAGRLYEIERWIAAGRSLRTQSKSKKSPLAIAVEHGFHSLVELLARNEADPTFKNKALAQAVKIKRLDLVELLIAHGAQLHSIPLIEVFLTWDPGLIRYFLENGADVITDSPFAIAFTERVQTTLRPFVEYKKSHPEIADQLQRQIDQALRYCTRNGEPSLRWISLLMWAGANPHTLGIVDFGDDPEDSEIHSTALHEACLRGHLEMVMKFKPNPSTDDLGDLFGCATYSRGDAVLDHLLKLGANPNNKANGGSAALDSCLTYLEFEGRNWLSPVKTPIAKHEVYRTLGGIRKLVEHGAKWSPDDAYAVNSVRRSFYACEPGVTVEVVKLLAKHNAATPETLEKLLDPPRMRQHLATIGIKTELVGKISHLRGSKRTK